VLHQLENDNANFVLDYSEAYPSTTPLQRQQIMGYYEPGFLPAIHELARHFAVCDHWYSSVPGPNWANRFFVHSGTSLGRVQMPEDLDDSLLHPGLYFGYDQVTIYDRLNERNVPWCIYHGDFPQSLVLTHQRTIENARRYEFIDVYFSDAGGHEERFPAFAFIEPSYYGASAR
jgi:phospholipase C